ncbi:hypothetical protein [Caulobacter sp. DWR2-3-1b2]|uniref:hypothetical protein n=1 Tax=unclassified Caulobacter TaxID=2648921 RepID=UPI003CE7D300
MEKPAYSLVVGFSSAELLERFQAYAAEFWSDLDAEEPERHRDCYDSGDTLMDSSSEARMVKTDHFGNEYWEVTITEIWGRTVICPPQAPVDKRWTRRYKGDSYWTAP